MAKESDDRPSRLRDPQIQDDYLDCFADPEVLGKIGTDIEDSKCSWLVVKALEKANAKQKKVIKDNYGLHDPAKVQKIKDLYREMKLEEMFRAYEEDAHKELSKEIREQKEVRCCSHDGVIHAQGGSLLGMAGASAQLWGG